MANSTNVRNEIDISTLFNIIINKKTQYLYVFRESEASYFGEMDLVSTLNISLANIV